MHIHRGNGTAYLQGGSRFLYGTARLVGVEHVGISSDWGGYPVNIKGIENAGEYQNIAQALLKRGYSREDVAKIKGENLLQIFDEVVRTAKHQ